MSMFDDIKTTVAGLDKDGNGIDFEDLKQLASEHGVDSAKMDDIKKDIVGPDGKLSADDATRLITDYMANAGNFFDDLKSKFMDNK